MIIFSKASVSDHPIQILILEDQALVAQGMRRVLEKAGYKVRVATAGEEWLQLWQAATASAVRTIGLLDLNIDDGLGGLEVARRLRGSGVPLIAVSGQSDDPVFRQPQEHGFTDTLAKPFTPADLLAKVGATASAD